MDDTRNLTSIIRDLYEFVGELERKRLRRHFTLRQDGHFSIVTSELNASVAPFCSHMPLVLGPGESNACSGSNFATLANLDAFVLSSKAEL